MMRVKLDEDLSESLASFLAAAGYSVATVRGQGWGGLKDSVLWLRVADERIFFITADKGFGDIRTFAPATHAGILILRPSRESLGEFQSLLEEVLNGRRLESLAGTVSVATPRRLRIRR